MSLIGRPANYQPHFRAPVAAPALCPCGQREAAHYGDTKCYSTPCVRTGLCSACWVALPPDLLRDWALAIDHNAQRIVASQLREFARSRAPQPIRNSKGEVVTTAYFQ